MRVKDRSQNWDICVNNLVKKFGKKVAVNDISFGMKPGTILGFLGTNGAGKSTTFKTMAGAHYPTSGSVQVKGQEMPYDLMNIR